MEFIFDTHAHYDDEAFDGDREQILSGLRALGIDTVVNVGSTVASCRSTYALAQRYPFVYAALGVHPSETGEMENRPEDSPNFDWLAGQETGENGSLSGSIRAELEEGTAGDLVVRRIAELAADRKVVAVGEIGLDYYWDEPERGIQKKWFVRQLALAKETGLPVIIHSREAAQDTLDLMKAEHGGATGGVIHCFSYSVEMAREYLNLGYYLGIGGVLTFKNAKKLKEVVEYAPLDRLVLETDCPYLAPVPYRGKRNFSGNLPLVAEAMAQLKHTDAKEIIRRTAENARKLYHLDGAAC